MSCVSAPDEEPVGPGPAISAPGARDVLLVTATWCGALAAVGPPPAFGLAVLGAAAWRRSWLLAAVGLFVLSGASAAAALDGLTGLRDGPVHAEVVLVGDPRPQGRGWRAEAVLGGRHVELRATGAGGALLRRRLAGERLVVTGEARAEPASGPWARSRHLAGEVVVSTAQLGGPPAPVSAWAIGLRRVLERGAGVLGGDNGALLLGILVGDDRALSPGARDDAVAAGLTHLTAVSGQNVAIALSVAGPLLRRLGLRTRLLASLGLLTFFVVLTGMQPSVLRAAAMAGAVVVAEAVGRPAEAWRVLGIAVVALVLIDPLLVHALGFQLSVAATAGILAFGPAVMRTAPGPQWLAGAVGATLGAQFTVAPLLLATGRPVSLVSVPANLLAAPLAGAAAVCGSVTTAPAGAIGGAVGAMVQAPARLAVAGVLTVAAVAARLPLGRLDWWGLAGVAAATPVVCARRSRRAALVGVLVLVGVAARSTWVEPSAATGRHPISVGAQLVVFDGVAVLELDGRADADGVLAATRRAGVDRVELVVLATDAPRAVAVAAIVVSRRGPASIVGPDTIPASLSATGVPVIGVDDADAPTLVDLGRAQVRVELRARRLVVVDGWLG